MADIYYKLDKKTKDDLVETVKRVAVEILEGPKETWLTGDEVSKMWPFFSKDWISKYGYLLPRKHIVTIEGFRETPQYRIIADAFADFGASQCGFCTPGMIVVTYALLKKNPNPTEEEIRYALSGNLCRCTGYQGIINSVKLAAKGGKND